MFVRKLKFNNFYITKNRCGGLSVVTEEEKGEEGEEEETNSGWNPTEDNRAGTVHRESSYCPGTVYTSLTDDSPGQ